MNRFKFRAWDTEWNHFSVLEDPDYLAYFTKNGLMLCDNGNPVKDNKYVIQQYTGIKDKSGREIYEGDIVNFTHRHKPEHFKNQAVVFAQGCYYFGDDLLLGYEITNIEIVGNIFENPELVGNR